MRRVWLANQSENVVMDVVTMANLLYFTSARVTERLNGVAKRGS